jgi:hypothetical protein
MAPVVAPIFGFCGPRRPILGAFLVGFYLLPIASK